MKLVAAVITGMLFVGVAGSANAAPADCEAERCLIQAQIDTECPCAEAKNHGRYTACVSRVVNAAAKAGTISRSCRGKINGCFIRSTCGKKAGAVACDLAGSGVGGRCRPLSSASQCAKRGGTVVATCCETCGPETTATPTPGPTEQPTAQPTGQPTEQPTGQPTEQSTAQPTEQPTAGPTEQPTGQPTAQPTEQPTAGPTEQPTGQPTGQPTEQPTAGPTEQPTGQPTAQPTEQPTAGPTGQPTEQPTAGPTEQPTAGPTEQPTAGPTEQPTAGPTEQPTEQPTDQPTPTVTVTPSPEPTSVTPGLCDEPGQPVCPNAGNGLEICSVTGTCNCPGKVSFTGDPSKPDTILDTGWTGIAHRAPVISNGDVTVTVSGCTGAGTTDRPQCPRDCLLSGPIENTLSTQLRNHRCSNDSSITCTDNTPCGTSHCIGGTNEDAACSTDSQCPGSQCSGAGGTCRFYFGAPLPLVAGGVGTCVENLFNGGITGTANLETGESSSVANLTSRVHSAVISTDTPCPICEGDATINDGVAGGTCTGGNRSGKPCDGNGTVFNRDDFGTTSLDCTTPIATIAVLPIDLTNSTGSVSKTLSASSPNCTAGGLPAGTKCICDTCNNANAEPCDSNADCPAGGICGGRRCLGGTNLGAACTVASQCPGGSCARPGQPTQPHGCSDDSTTAENEAVCLDTAPVGDNEGECPAGPPTGVCSDSSGHPQRSCQIDAECCDDAPGCASDPVTAGECLVGNRLCFLDNGVLGNSITGTGMADPPVNDVALPTLAAVFCIGPTSAPAVNIAAGLPGPGRVTINGTALGLP